ncbi:MAG: LysR family transcriptional regulator [Deltaproteobacteria bacterium]|nr:LysR family transcriptional regulator [Deltaproteobacteria bacterium]
MNSGNDALGKAAVFAAVVREGSFSAGAKALGLARSTASEHVSALETSLGVRLLERTTRTIRLTEEGELMFDRIDGALRAWTEARDALEQRSGEPVGTLRVTAPSGLATALVAPTCGALVRSATRVSVELLVDDAVRDIVADRIDVAIRMAKLPDSALVCRKLGSTLTVLVGSPEYASAPAPRDELDAITRHRWVGHSAVPGGTVNLTDPSGQHHVIRPRYTGRATSSEGEIGLLEHHCGIALLPELLVRESLAAGRLVRLFPGWHGREIPIYAVYPRNTFTPPRVSRFLELLGQRLDTLR